MSEHPKGRESNGAVEKARTSTGLLLHAPQACASTNSATTARGVIDVVSKKERRGAQSVAGMEMAQ